MGFPCGSAGKESPCNAGDPGLIPGSGRSLGEGIGYLLQYSCLENSVDCIIHGVAKNQTWLSDVHVHFRTSLCVCSDLAHPKGVWVLRAMPCPCPGLGGEAGTRTHWWQSPGAHMPWFRVRGTLIEHDEDVLMSGTLRLGTERPKRVKAACEVGFSPWWEYHCF